MYLSILMAIFPGGPGLAGTKMSPFWILLELRLMEAVVTTGAVRRAKLQSNRYHQETDTQRFTGQMPFLSPNSVKAMNGNTSEYVHIILHRLARLTGYEYRELVKWVSISRYHTVYWYHIPNGSGFSAVDCYQLPCSARHLEHGAAMS